MNNDICIKLYNYMPVTLIHALTLGKVVEIRTWLINYINNKTGMVLLINSKISSLKNVDWFTDGWSGHS